MTCSIIRASDLRPFLPAGSVTDDQLAILVEDAQALIAHHVPCLSTATEEVRAAARALIRQSLRRTLGDQANSVTYTHGPFTEKRSYTATDNSILPDDLIGALRTLCDPSRGSKMAVIDIDYVDHIPAYDYGEAAIPDLRWW